METRRRIDALKVCGSPNVSHVSSESTTVVLRNKPERSKNVCRIPVRNMPMNRSKDSEKSTEKILRSGALKGNVMKSLGKNTSLNGTFTNRSDVRPNAPPLIRVDKFGDATPSTISKNKTMSRIPKIINKKMLGDDEKENLVSAPRVLRNRIIKSDMAKENIGPNNTFISTVHTRSSSTQNKSGNVTCESKVYNAVATMKMLMDSFDQNQEKVKAAPTKGSTGSLAVNENQNSSTRVLRNRVMKVAPYNKTVENTVKSARMTQSFSKRTESENVGGLRCRETRSKISPQSQTEEHFSIGKGSLRRRSTVTPILAGSAEPLKNLKVPRLTTKNANLENGGDMKSSSGSQEQLFKDEVSLLCSTPLKNYPSVDRKELVVPKQMEIPLSPIKPSILNILDDAADKNTLKRASKKDAPQSLQRTKKMTTVKGNSIPLKKSTNRATKSSPKVSKLRDQQKENDKAPSKGIPSDFLDAAEAVLLARPVRALTKTSPTTNKIMCIHSSDSSSGHDSFSSNYNPFDLFVLEEPIKFEEISNPSKRSKKPSKPNLNNTYVVETKDKKRGRQMKGGMTDKEVQPNEVDVSFPLLC